MKRVLACLTVGVLLTCSGIGAILAQAFEIRNGACGSDLTWTFRNGTLTIEGTGEMDAYAVSLFGQHMYVHYTSGTNSSRQPWAGLIGEIRSVVVCEGVTSIGNGAFEYCDNLRSVSLPQTLTRIGRSAFACCGSLDDVRLPKGVTTVGELAFGGCGRVYVDADNPAYAGDDNGVLYCADRTILLHYPVDADTESFAIPDGVRCVQPYAFAFCTRLKQLTVPGSLRCMRESFSLCTSLESVTILQGVTEIDNYAFYKCGCLRRADLPEGLKTIGFFAFADTSLDYLHIPHSVTQIDNCVRTPDDSDDDTVFPYMQAFYICSDSPDGAAEQFADDSHIRFCVCGGRHDGKTVRANAALAARLLYVQRDSAKATALLSALLRYMGRWLKRISISSFSG